MSSGRTSGQRGRSRLSVREGGPRARRNSALATQGDDVVHPLAMDENGRFKLVPLPKVEKIKAPTSDEGKALNALLDALQQMGMMED